MHFPESSFFFKEKMISTVKKNLGLMIYSVKAVDRRMFK
jgi:hypothetical protein